jgi:hypothetical protein
MYPQYSSIPNQNYNDMEKQPLQEDITYQQQPQCQCIRRNTCYIESNARRRPSKFALFIFGILGFIFLGHMFGYHCRDKVVITNDKKPYLEEDTLTTTSSSSLSMGDMNTNNYWKVNTCSGGDSLDIPWEGKTTFYVPHDVKGLKISEKYKHSNVKLVSGDVFIVENNNLNQTRIKFDIKLNKEDINNQFCIDETVNEKEFKLTLVHAKYGPPGCIKINAHIEVPSSDALNQLNLAFINDDITVKNVLNVNGNFALATANGDLTLTNSLISKSINLATANGAITAKNTITASDINLATSNGDITVEETATSLSTLNLATANGDIQGVFDLNQAKFNANSARGNLDIKFDHIDPVSTIKADSASGNINLQVPSNFESKFHLTTVVGKANVEATNSDKLHYKRSGHIVGETVKGNYGEDEKNPSEITVSTVAGNIKLNYQ